jgi:hypothetical protein
MVDQCAHIRKPDSRPSLAPLLAGGTSHEYPQA